MTLNGVKYTYETNAQGDVTGLIDSNGNEVVTYQYDSWGKLLGIGGSLSSTVGVANPFRYRGYYYDTETELYYLQSRYYDPELGRFISKDDPSYHTGQDAIGSNLYAYADNNPVMNIDPTGQSVLLDTIAIILTVVGVIKPMWWLILIGLGIATYDFIVSENDYKNASASLYSKLRKGIISSSTYSSRMRYNNTLRMINWVLSGFVVIASAIGILNIAWLSAIIPNITQVFDSIIGALGIVGCNMTWAMGAGEYLSGKNLYEYS
jgi:RHS repeat-associated protein